MNLKDLNIDHSWTLFLDRDGVINKRIVDGYVTSWKEFDFLEGVLDSLSMFSSIFGRIIVVTNQQGIGKGLMTEEDLDVIHQELRTIVGSRGGRIDAIYYCPDLKSVKDNCRKPSTKMAGKAKQQFPAINFDKSIMAGDSLTDMQFGKNAGMLTVYIESEKQKKIDKSLVNFTFEGLIDFAKAIK
jgi:D-glycero-D-manno-heptose 1,7-bisphosphate phosphatase